MKKSFKVLAMLLALTLTIGLGAGSAKAKSIYFAGEYSKRGAMIQLNQYSSPEGKAYGNFTVNIPHFYNAYSGELIKIGKNKYRSKKKGLVFTIKKKKFMLKVTNKKRYDRELKGTYKLKKRYYS